MGDAIAIDSRQRIEPSEAPPPHDLRAERAMLRSCILFDEPLFASLQGTQRAALEAALELLTPASFFDTAANGRIFQVVGELYRAGVNPDMVTVRRALEDRGWLEKVGGDRYLREVADAPSVASGAKAHALIIDRKARARAAIALMLRACAELRRGIPGGEDDLLQTLPDDLRRASCGGPSATCVTLKEAFKESFLDVERAMSGQVAGFCTGIQAIDRLTGGLQPGEVVLLKAPKKSGKSVLMGQIASAIARWPMPVAKDQYRWRGSLIFALEGKTRDWSTRMACSQARIDYDALLKGLWTDVEMRAFAGAADDLSRFHVRIEADKRLTIDKVAARVRAVKEEMLAAMCMNCAGRGRFESDVCAACKGSGRGVDLAFVGLDYAQLMRDLSGNSKTNREQFLSGFVSDLMDLAASPDLSGVAWEVNSQMNAGGVARESEAIEMHVDRVWKLSIAREREDAEGLRAKLNVEYSRRGPMGDDVNAAFWFEPAHTVFYG